jgi:large subunit ribosomal protein L4
MKAPAYNQKGEKLEDIVLPKEIFEVPMNSDLVYQIAVSSISNRKQKTAKTKGRGEVRGGGKKPWRQKGTGRARHGSIRSPLWIGGGVTFGPQLEKNLKKTTPKKMRRKALFMVLSAKAKSGWILIIDGLKLDKPKTKPMAEFFNKLFLKQGSGIVALDKKDDNLIKSIRNIRKINVMQARDLNVLDLLNYKYLVMTKGSVKVLKETFLKD